LNKNKVLDLIEVIRNRHFLIADLIIFSFSPSVALLIRFDGGFNLLLHIGYIGIITLAFMLIKLIVFWWDGIYKRIWKLASIDEMVHLVVSGIIITALQFMFLAVGKKLELGGVQLFPYSLSVIDAVIAMMFVSGLRFSLRFTQRAIQRWYFSREQGIKVLIIGAGEAGVLLLSEIQKNKNYNLRPIGFLDDDPSKVGMRIRGVPVLGTTKDISHKIQEHSIKRVLLAIPTASGAVVRRIVEICNSEGLEIQTLPSILEIIDGRINISKLRKIRIEDLLRREVFNDSNLELVTLVHNKCILITGAGGSIGSEIVRQVSKLSPAEIILLGHGENSIFNIEQEFKDVSLSKDYVGKKMPNIIPLICDIKDLHFMESVFSQFKPQIVFHAAAHKHVPLMEANVFEAIKNNIYGTKNLVELSAKYNVLKFVLISSDKAVNPTNVMGATKRIAELLMLNESKNSKTSFCAVRFGNVLGSRGSVVHTFQKQIKAGGPLTITHPDIMRYFMTIPEAVKLVLEACTLSENGEIFVLDMGEPVKIIDLAKDMIRLSGLKEGQDIEIKYTALRPGEKLFEELFVKGEEYEKTRNRKILIAKNASINIPLGLDADLKTFNDLLKRFDEKALLEHILKIVPEFLHQTNKSKSVEKENVIVT